MLCFCFSATKAPLSLRTRHVCMLLLYGLGGFHYVSSESGFLFYNLRIVGYDNDTCLFGFIENYEIVILSVLYFLYI